MSENILWHNTTVTKQDRQQLNQHQSFVLWFTGLSGSGKSTIANAVDLELYELGKRSFILDGDNVRHGLNKGLGFSKEDRNENLRRVGEVSKLFVESGHIIITAFISPYKEDRSNVRNLFSNEEFIEIFIDCPLHVCERRDPKGLYSKARKGEIKNFTGIDAPYYPPTNPELVIDTVKYSVDDAKNLIINYLQNKKLI